MSHGRARLRRALISSGPASALELRRGRRPSDHQAAAAIPETPGCRRTSTPTIVAAVAVASFGCTKADQGSTESRPTIRVHRPNSRPKAVFPSHERSRLLILIVILLGESRLRLRAGQD